MRLWAARRLTPDRIAEVDGLIDAAAAVDGRPAVSAETVQHLRHPSPDESMWHVLAQQPDRLVGYGALTTAAGPRSMLAEIAVLPEIRRHGVGEAVLAELQRLAAPASVSIWAHGRNSHTAPFALARGLRRQRRLWQMRRDLGAGIAPEPLPPGYRLETFRPGVDDDAFLAANAAAFRDLPDQGGWTATDLAARMSQDWFDPAGFLLARRSAGAGLAGFHWTKLPLGQPVGEIYVLGVVPDHRGAGLARCLALHGLAHLHSAGAREAMLYVDEANHPAIGLYQRLGFSLHDTDTLYGA